MNRETIVTAIVALVVAIFDLLKVFGIYVPIEDNTIYTIVSLIVAAVIYWRNQDYSEVARVITPIMRKNKTLLKHGDRRLLEQIVELAKEWDEENGEDFMEDENYDD